MAAKTRISKDGALTLSHEAYDALSENAAFFRNGEDALHNVLERLLRNPRETHEGYLKNAVRNASIDLWRAGARRHRYEGAYAGSASLIDEDGPQEALEGGCVALALQQVVDGLSELDQVLFERRYLDGEALNDIAKDLRLSRSTIEKRLRKIKRSCYRAISEPPNRD